MKMLKRWIAFCLVIILLAGVAFNNSSVMGSQVEAADLENPEAAEAEAAAAEASVLSETGGDTEQTEESTEAQTEESPVAEEEPAAAESEDLAEETKEQADEEVKSEAPKDETAAEPETKTEQAQKTEAADKEEEAQIKLDSLNFENDDVTITVSEVEAGAIPEGAELKVVPILADDEDTEDQYKEVEEQIQKKAEEDEKEIKGFLAYDITFVDADGNEVEPNSEVKVTMEYKEPALPAWKTTMETKDTEVSILHLEEDKDGNVKEVVDMNEAGQVDALETGNEQQVQKVEVRTESFSTFVISWNYTFVNVKFVDENGKELRLNNSDNYNINLTSYNTHNPFKTSDITSNGTQSKYYEITTTSGEKYQFVKAIDSNDREVTQIYYQSNWGGGNGYYKTKGNNSERYLNYGNLSFVYQKISGSGKPGTIETLDTADIIDIDLYKYQYNRTYDCGLYFGSGTGGGDNLYNRWIGDWTFGNNKPYSGDDNRAVQGIMDNNLYYYDNGTYKPTTAEQNWEGIPKLAVGNKKVTSELFSTKVNTQNLNHLFKSGENGYYVYNSAQNYAYYDQSGSDFVVYDGIDNKQDNTSGDFMPLVDYGDEITNNNWSYGMRVGFNFIQPEDGQINGQDMVFSFSGDDDVWVFVDGKLVLDLGGIHGAVGGTINFKTGEVKVDDVVSTYHSGIRNVLGQKTSLKNIFKLEGNTFAPYSEHRLEFIYFERGASMSNCKLEFNLQPIPSDAINITKEITNTDKEKYTDVDFSFKLYLENSESGELELVPEGTEYDLYEGTTKISTSEVGADGIFKLKDGQTARFNNIPRNLQYYVEEVDLDSDEYSQVEVVGGEITYYDDNNHKIDSATVDPGKDYIAQTEIKHVYEAKSVVFKNWCAGTNLRELQITKEWSGSQTTDDTFSFNIKLGGTAETLQNYTGSYYLKRGDQYCKNDNGTPVATDSSEVYGTITNGNVSGIPVGYTVVLTQILSDTYFEVTEINLDTAKYGDPTYQVTPETAGDINVTGKAYGVILLGKNAEVKVTNRYLSAQDNPYIEIKKTFGGISDPATELSGFAINVSGGSISGGTIELTLDETEDYFVEKKQVDGSWEYTWKIENLDAGMYFVNESNYTGETGKYTVTTTVNGETVTSWPVEIKTEAPKIEAVDGFGRDTPCSEEIKDFKNDYNLIVASLQGSKNYFVWSKDRLSAGEREGVREFISQKWSTFNQISSEQATIYYYSGFDNLEQGITINGGTIKVTNEDQYGMRSLIFASSKNQWQQVLYGQYKKTDAVDAEISIVNSYEENGIDVDIEKYGTDYDVKLDGAKFELYRQNTNQGWDKVNEYDITDAVELSRVTPGIYKLVETQSPRGYSLLGEEIYFQIASQQVALLDKTTMQPIFGNSSEMYQAVSENGQWKIQVKNNCIYELPESGSTGIYWYLFGGVLLMMAASLMVYKNKRREVLERK